MAGSLVLDLFVAFLFTQFDSFLVICIISSLLTVICIFREILVYLLIEACQTGDLELLRGIKSIMRSPIVEFLSLCMIQETYFNYALKYQGRCLRGAIENGKANVWKELLETAEVVSKPEEHICNKADEFGETPLHTACKNGVIQAVEDLLAVRDQNKNLILNPNVPLNALAATTGEALKTPLMMAMNHNHLEVVKILLNSKLVVAGNNLKSSAMTNLVMDEYKTEFLPAFGKYQSARKDLVERLFMKEEKESSNEFERNTVTYKTMSRTVGEYLQSKRLQVRKGDIN